MPSRLIWACALTLAFAGAVQAEAYLCIPEIRGSAEARDFEGCIEVFGMGDGAEKDSGDRNALTRFSPVKIVKRADAATPLVFEAVADGTMLSEAELTVLAACADRPQPYLKYKLTNVQISSYSLSGGAQALPVEQLSLNWEKVEWTYIERDETCGQIREITRTWDRSQTATF